MRGSWDRKGEKGLNGRKRGGVGREKGDEGLNNLF